MNNLINGVLEGDIEKGAFINAKNSDGDTAADLAEEEGYRNIVALLSNR